MKHFAFGIVASIGISGCTAPNIASVASPITALLTVAGDVVTLEEELADEFQKESARLYFLSSGRETCLDNSGIKPTTNGTYIQSKDIRRQEEAYLHLRLADLYALAKYAEDLETIEKGRAKREKEIQSAIGIINTGAQLVGNNTQFSTEAKAVTQGINAVGAVAILINSNAAWSDIRRTAYDKQKQVNAMITRLEDKFDILSDRAQLYVNAWRACTREKFVYIRDRKASMATPVSIVDLDTNYGAFRTRLSGYTDRIPHIKKESFAKIRDANTAMVNAQSLEEFQKRAENLAALVGQLVTTYTTVKQSAQTIFGS